MTQLLDPTAAGKRFVPSLEAINHHIRNMCVYCRTFLQQDYTPQNPWDYIIETGLNYVVVPTKGALVPGWLLVVGKEHYLSRASLTKNEFEAFEVGIQRACAIVQAYFGTPTIFESGPSTKASTIGCGIDHVHVHVLPLQFSLTDATSKMFPQINWLTCAGFEQLQDLRNLGEPYFYIKEPNRDPLYAVPEARPSQLLRKVIAAEIGQCDLWDYSRYDGFANASQTLNVVLKA